MESFAARYNDGRTARTDDVIVRLTPSGLSIFDQTGKLLESWPGEKIRFVDPKSAQGPLRVAKSENDLACVTIEGDNVRALFAAKFPGMTRLHGVTRQTVARIFGWSGAAIAGVVLLVWVILPFVAEKVAAAIPMSWQARVGEKVEQQILGLIAVMEGKPVGELTCKNPAGLAAVAKMTQRLAAAPHPDIPLRVRVVDSKMINALAMPGGRIILTRAIINFVSGPNELAGILGHEIGHVASNHSLERMIQVGGVTAMFSMLVGDVAGGAIIIAVGQALINGQYSQAAEREADEHAVRLLAKGKYDSRPFALFFDRLESKQLAPKSGNAGRIWRWVGSHPPSGERTKAIRGAAQDGSEILSQAEWRSFKAICKK